MNLWKKKRSETISDKEEYFTASRWQLIFSRFRRIRTAMVALYLLLFFIFTSIFAPFLSPYSPDKAGYDPDYLNGPPQMIRFWDENGLAWPYVPEYKKTYTENLILKYQPDFSQKREVRFFVKGWEYCLINISVFDYRVNLLCSDRHLFGLERGKVHLFGTDQQKKDLFSRTIFSIRVSLMVGTLGVLVSFILALIIGGIAGYFGGATDRVIQMITDTIRVIPSIPLFMAMSSFLPDEWSSETRFFFISLILGLIGWPTLARRVRTHILAERTQDYILAAKLCGASPSYVIRRHLLPSFTGYIIVDLMISFPYMVLSETALSFIGLGLKEPVNSLGVLMQNVTNVDVMLNYQWYFIPVPVFVLLVLTFVFVGDGLRDAADPYAQIPK